MTSPLIEFLLRRIGDDEDWATATLDPHALVGRFGLGRILRECEGKRLVVRFLSDLERGNYEDPVASSVAYSVLCRLAEPYADHPEFDAEWAGWAGVRETERVMLDLMPGESQELVDYLLGTDMHLSIGDRLRIARQIQSQRKPKASG